MADATHTRKRAVTLTELALADLVRALHGKWESSSKGQKLTWETRSEIMGVRVATARRVLAREGVDRATLTFIYKNLDLSWDDSFCESKAAYSDNHTLPPVPSPLFRQRPFRLVLIGGLLMGSLLFAGYRLTFEVNESSPLAINVFADLQTAEAQYHKGNYRLATRMANRALMAARRDNSAAHAAYALRILGDLATVEGTYKRAAEMYEQALTVKDVFRDERARPDLLEALGAVQVKAGLLDAAERSFTQALQEFERFRALGGVAMACRGLGTVAYHRKRYQRALEWFQKSLTAVRGLKDADLIETDVHSRQALVYADLGRLPQARSMLESCLKFWQERNHSRWIAETQLALATVELKAGNDTVAKNLATSSKTLFARIGDNPGHTESVSLISRIRS